MVTLGPPGDGDVADKMCASYEANPNDSRWDLFSLFPVPNFDYRSEIYKDYYAPIFRRGAEDFETVPASFGIVPRRHIPPGVKVFDTMNARSESIAEKRSFSPGRSTSTTLFRACFRCGIGPLH